MRMDLKNILIAAAASLTVPALAAPHAQAQAFTDTTDIKGCTQKIIALGPKYKAGDTVRVFSNGSCLDQNSPDQAPQHPYVPPVSHVAKPPPPPLPPGLKHQRGFQELKNFWEKRLACEEQRPKTHANCKAKTEVPRR